MYERNDTHIGSLVPAITASTISSSLSLPPSLHPSASHRLVHTLTHILSWLYISVAISHARPFCTLTHLHRNPPTQQLPPSLAHLRVCLLAYRVVLLIHRHTLVVGGRIALAGCHALIGRAVAERAGSVPVTTRAAVTGNCQRAVWQLCRPQHDRAGVIGD